MKARFVIPFCLASGLSFSTFGANMDARLAKNDAVCGGYEVFHINGVLTDLAKATDNLNEIRAAYGNSYKEHLINYHLAYNQTRDAGGDLIDSYNQVLRAYPGTTMEEFTRAVMLGVGSNILTANIVSMLAGKWAALFNIDRPAAYTDQDVINIADAFFAKHKKNNRILTIPHSQGNFYWNTIYPKLLTGGQYGSFWAIQAKAIQTLALAAPIERIESAGVHITSTNDNVMNAVRLTFPRTLAGNITIPVVDLLGHNLIGVYLRYGLPGRNAVINGMTARMDLLKSTVLTPATNWLRGQAEFVRCGPAAWPYGTGVEPITEIQCPITKSLPTYPYSYLWGYTSEDYVKYTNVNLTPGNMDGFQFLIPGLASQASPLAKAFVVGCYNAYIADRKAQLAAGVPTYASYLAKNLGSCGYGYPNMYPYGYSDAAWNIYSGDLPYLVLPLMSPSVKSDTYQVDLKPNCRV